MPATSVPNSNNGLRRSYESGVGQYTSKSSSSTSSQQSISTMYKKRPNNLRVFDLPKLCATDEFHRMLKIDEGGFDSIYKGFVYPTDGKGEKIMVAVKPLNHKSLQIFFNKQDLKTNII